VAQLHDVVYIVYSSSRLPSTIVRFNATTRQQLTDIRVRGLQEPWDIAACEPTSQLYIVQYGDYVWCVSADGADMRRLVTRSSSGKFRPTSLSVASARLLVTSRYTNQLIQFGSFGDELRRIQLPDHMEPFHAVESPTATFIVSQENTQLKQWQISEVNTDGQVLRQFTGSRLSSLGCTQHIAIDSHGNVFVADSDNGCILLLDDQLTLRRRIIDKHQLRDKRLCRLCYREPTGQLLVGSYFRVAVFYVLKAR